MHDSATPKAKGGATAERITVRGLVQGVGFRPTVWRLARELSLSGTVSNNGDGVEIYICGEISNIDKFVLAIRAKTPALSRIDSITRTTVPVEPDQAEFRIIHSDSSAVTTGIVPDATVCDECRAETLDTFARRFRYPFTNCTNCGPRLSIIENIPYDRANTTMRGFEMCSDCRDEYEDPADRRFHAQPVACHKCGPRVWLERADGQPMSVEAFAILDDADAVLTLIQRGSIVAIKGIGGFQLACDAGNEEAVSRLRSLKHRQLKPFALMVRDIEVARQICQINDIEQELLLGAAAPIVILDRLVGPTVKIGTVDEGKITSFRSEPPDLNVSIADSVAPGINSLGLMLPNTPLHHLILSRMPRPIVLTSGNISDEPQSIDNDQAAEHLSGIADYFLLNDRPIAQRVDDSVVRMMAGESRVLRRARGYAPSPFVLPSGFESAPPILAYGGELKNTFCLIRDGQAIVSQHIGDLENAETQADYCHNLELYETLYQHQPA
ncbi:MAG: carbamoyltransferase HypF, partial [Pyrinomonadaceae bacterium]